MPLRSAHLFAALCTFSACAVDTQPSESATEDFSGGANGTVFDRSRAAFSQSFPKVAGELEESFFVGNAIFNRGWVAAPASVTDFDGLGPVYNATNCSACHFKDGRGAPPENSDDPFVSMLLRISIPGPEGGDPVDEPTYGSQIQPHGIQGVPGEGREHVRYTVHTGQFADGETYELAHPTYSVSNLGYGPMDPRTMISPRVAPGVYGAGLLEAIPEDALRALEDPEDRNGDGISGRLRLVFSPSSQATHVGRFGWKAGAAFVRDQTAAAFLGDMGITSSMHPQESCTTQQSSCLSAPRSEGPDLAPTLLDMVTAYQRYLAVPARRNRLQADVARGAALFTTLGCAVCHAPTFETGAVDGDPLLSHQTIRPYADLLLHDMGPELADGRPEGSATGTEWKTPPLWGIGLVPVVNKHTRFMHDGRARSLQEAILWHGGEGQRSRLAFMALPKVDRAALTAFLASL